MTGYLLENDFHVPVISRFYGIVIVMYLYDHQPPHFHAKYSGHEATFNFDGRILKGELPRRAVKLVHKWLRLHRVELQANWQRAAKGQPLLPVDPLE